jgi:hypothetical protein
MEFSSLDPCAETIGAFLTLQDLGRWTAVCAALNKHLLALKIILRKPISVTLSAAQIAILNGQ